MGKAYRPKVLSEEQDDVFKVPPLPDQKGKGKAPDIAKELEKANKAVCHASFSSFSPTHPVLATSHRWSSELQVIVSPNTGFTRPMRTLKKSGASYTVELNLLWCV